MNELKLKELVCPECGTPPDEWETAFSDAQGIDRHVECPKCGKHYVAVYLLSYIEDAEEIYGTETA